MQPKPPGRGPLPGPSYQSPSNPAGNSGQSVGAGRTASANIHSTSQFLRTPIVRYSSRMRVGKLHALRVTLNSIGGESEANRPLGASGSFDPPVVVQLTVPGALVTPPHVIIPVSGGEANFTVQPLMSGRLPGAKIEFLSQGRKVSEVLLPMKANRGYLAKFLLLLALLLPFIIHYFPDLTFEEQLVPAVVGVPPAGLPGTGSGRIAAPPPPSKSNDKSPAKLNVVPQKKNEEKTTPAKPPEKSPPAGEKKAHLNSTDSPFDQNSLSLLVSVTTLIQTENGNNRLRGSIPGKVLQASLGDISDIVKSTNQDAADKSDVAVKQKGSQSLTRYTGEDAIWAWVRSKLHRSGYKTKLLPINFAEGLAGLYTVNRGYEIVGENNTDWNTHRLVSIGLYYLEPVMRFLYRFFIQFPKIWPFGDIIFPLFMLALAAIAWVFTGPNRRKVKGSVMDIRLAA